MATERLAFMRAFFDRLDEEMLDGMYVQDSLDTPNFDLR
jgi:hypothetical protein